MIEIKNQDLFNKIVSDSIEAAIINSKTCDTAKRWQNAISRAEVEIQNNPYLDYDELNHSLLILSPRSNNIYAANGVCQCIAYELQTPCWHRAAARLVRLYLEAEIVLAPPAEDLNPAPAIAAVSALSDFNDAPYLTTYSRKNETPEKIGGIRI